MTEQANSVIEPDQAAAVYAENLLHHYSFELGGHRVQELLTRWFDRYPIVWVRLAIVEALYQGRYKAVSVEQILIFWQRRGQPCPHFNHEFERLVCNKFPRNLAPASESAWSVALLPSSVAPLLPRAKRDAVRSMREDTRSSTSPRRSGSRFHPAQTATGDAVSSGPDEFRSDNAALHRSADSAKVTNLLERLDALKRAQAATYGESSRFSESAVLPAPACKMPTPAITEAPALKEQSWLQRLQTIAEQLPPLPDWSASHHPALTPTGSSAAPVSQPYQPHWQSDRESHQPIHKFTPASETADFSAKLRAVAQPEFPPIAPEPPESLDPDNPAGSAGEPSSC